MKKMMRIDWELLSTLIVCPLTVVANITGPNQISTSGPGLDTRAELDEGGRIDLWMDLKHNLAKGAADLPEDYAIHIEEYAVDKNARDCPPLNIVIFLVTYPTREPR
jgi:hypothetical protein